MGFFDGLGGAIFTGVSSLRLLRRRWTFKKECQTPPISAKSLI
jgi:hypothetical protein